MISSIFPSLLTLIAFLKNKVGYRTKKLNIFSKDDVIKFLNEADDEHFLIHKIHP